MAAQEKSGFDLLESILFEMNGIGKFPKSVLTDKEGLPIASATDRGESVDRQSAVVAFLQKNAIQGSRQLGFTDPVEVTFSYEDGLTLVILPFSVKDKGLLLAVLVTERDQAYRKVTSTAIAEIIKVWEYYWT